MQFLIVLTAGLAASTAAAQAPNPADAFPTHSDNYSVAWGGTGLGDATIALSALPEKDCYRYEQKTRPVALVRWIYGSPRETSYFCVVDGVIRPSHFEYANDRRPRDSFTLDFDWPAHKLKVQRQGKLSERDLPEVAYDRLCLQQAVRLWARAHAGDAQTAPMDFNMADDTRITPYRFAILGRESVDTPAGRFDTVRVERTDNPRRYLRSWLAPARDYAPVRIEQVENGEVKLRMLLK